MRKIKWNTLMLILTSMLVSMSAQAKMAPKAGQQSQTEQAAKKETAPESSIYRVAYKLSEVEDGKTINSRSYTLMAKTRDRASSRVGSRIPIATSAGQGAQYQYQDVGMNVDCVVTKSEGSLMVHTEIGLTTIQDGERSTSSMSPPVLRHLSLGDDTVVTLGKPAFVGSVDDVASNRRFVVEVTVTKAD